MQLHRLAGTWFPINAHVCRTMRTPREEIIRGALKIILAVANYFGIVHAVPGGIDKQCALSKFQAGPNQPPSDMTNLTSSLPPYDAKSAPTEVKAPKALASMMRG